MSANVVTLPRRVPRRIPLDRELETVATAARFAAAIAQDFITPEIKAHIAQLEQKLADKPKSPN